MPTATELQDIANTLNGAFETTAFSLSPDGTGLSLADTSQSNGNVDVSGAAGNWTVTLTGASRATPLSVPMFGGFSLALIGLSATVQGTAVTVTSGPARIDLPFFSPDMTHPERLDVELTSGGDGLGARLAEAQTDPKQQGSDGKAAVTFSLTRTSGATQKLLNVELSLDSLDIAELGGKRWIRFDGDLTVKVTTSIDSSLDLTLPKASFEALRVASNGDIDCSHAWLDLGKKVGIDRGPFTLHLSKVGFGSEPFGGRRSRWIGFAGDVSVGSGLKAGGKVRGLRIDLETGDVYLAGFDIEFDIPTVLELKGSVDHLHAADQSEYDASDSRIGLPAHVSVGGRQVSPFPLDVVRGGIDLKLLPIQLGLDAQFMAGSVGGVSLVGIVIAADLGVGIPLFPGINLKSLQGMFAYNLRPDPSADDPPHTWWQWYRYPTRDDGRLIVQDDPADGSDDTTSEKGDDAGDDNGPDDSYSATSLQKWLYPHDDAWGLAVGAAIGTTDDGWTASAGVLLALLFPGPVIILSGKADVLKSPITKPNTNGLFHALAVFDGGAGTFDMAIDMHYKVPSVVNIHGTAELFISSGHGWYLALGKPRHDQRVSARIADTFEVDAYFVVSDSGVVVGAYAGWQKSWGFGPLNVSLGAHLAVLAAIQWAPFELGGGIQIGGEAALSAFGIGMGVAVDALVEACAPNPFWIHGEFDVSLDLPWPLPDLSASVGLSWGGDDGTVPPAPLALSTVQAVLGDHNGLVVEHSGTSDHYTLLAHTAAAPAGDPYLSYVDSEHASLMRGNITADPEWARRSADPQGVLPPNDLSPLESSAAPVVSVVPQDAHLLLTFARPMIDKLGFAGADNAHVPDDVEAAQPSPLLPADDMSNLNPNPPAPRFAYRSSLKQVTIYEHRDDGWHVVASAPHLAEGEGLAGEWVAQDTTTTPPKAQPNVNLTIRPVLTGADGVKRPALPDAPALYAVKVVTEITAKHAGDSGEGQPVPGSPIVEFAFLQTATGPGLAQLPGMPGQRAPAVTAPVVPATTLTGVFPRGGQLADLTSYVQWSWPGNGDLAAYWGYDANVEFDESYVNALYGALSDDPVQTLHLRCHDRNGRHTLFTTTTDHVPSAPLQSAVVAAQLDVGRAPTAGGDRVQGGLAKLGVAELRDALYAGITQAREDGSAVLSPVLSGLARHTLAVAATSAGMPAAVTGSEARISLNQAARLIHLIDDIDWFAMLAAIWPEPLAPSTRYAMDVVGGPALGARGGYGVVGTRSGSAPIVAGSSESSGELRYRAVEQFFEREDGLTSLYHFEFQTSRYRRFSDQLANAVTQSDDPANLVRRYLAAVDPQGWLGDPAHRDADRIAVRDAYLTARGDLASFIGSFDPSDPDQQRKLRDKRTDVGGLWNAFSAATSDAFDRLVADLGWPELASTRVVPLPPDTELSAFVDAEDHIVALLVQSPEPIPWRRVWQWTSLEPADVLSPQLRGVHTLWCSDMTRAVIVPIGQPRGSYVLAMAFHGNIGAEAQCITSGERRVLETVRFGAFRFRPSIVRPPIDVRRRS